jgi:disulfide bond formation protein DsbB
MPVRSKADARLLAPGLALTTATCLLVGALMFQYVGGLAPCALCIWQRWPHAAAIVLAAAAIALRSHMSSLRMFTALAGISLLVTAGVGVFHVGVEQELWSGTVQCGATGTAKTLEELRVQIMAAPVVRCTDVPWSMFGVSMAGWNAIVSGAVGVVVLAIAARINRPGHRSA